MSRQKLALIFQCVVIIFLSKFCKAATADVSPVPFVYLNQYFNFQIINDHEVKISETSINFDDLKISIRGQQTILDIGDVKFLNTNDAAFLIKSNDPKKNNVRMAIVKDKLQYTFTAPFEISWVCITQSSAFTKSEICRDPNLTNANNKTNAAAKASFQPVVKIDGESFDGSGIVVLKDNLESVTFEAELSGANRMRMTTKKRKIYPRKIQKEANQEFMQIRFVDVNLAKNNSWTEKVSVEQTYFDIALDPLIKLRQDIYYKNDKLKSDEINYVYVEIKKPAAAQVYFNDITAEFFGIYLGLGGQSASLKVSLNSYLGKGVSLSSKLRINSKIDAHYSASFGQINFVRDSTNVIYNPSQSLFSAGGGVAYHLKSKFDVLAKLEIRKDLFFRRHDLTTTALDIVSGLNKEISVAPAWTFLATTNSSAHFQFGFSYLLAGTAESETVNSGLGYKFNFDYIYQLPFGNIKFDTYYYKRQQNSENFTINEQTAYYSAGYQYLF